MRRMSNTNYGNFTFHYQAIGHLSVFFTKQYAFSIADLGGGGREGRGGVPHNRLPIQGGSTHKGVSFSEPQEYERVEISLVEVFKRVGKYAISMICKTK